MAVPRGFREEIESARLTLRALYRAVDRLKIAQELPQSFTRLVQTREGIAQARLLMENEPDHQPALPSMVLPYAARVATHGTTTAAHMQGGLGFTVEADASLYFLRAKGWSVVSGDPTADLLAVGADLAARAGA